jgi:hypothetical protein
MFVYFIILVVAVWAAWVAWETKHGDSACNQKCNQGRDCTCCNYNPNKVEDAWPFPKDKP